MSSFVWDILSLVHVLNFCHCDKDLTKKKKKKT
jgi:hypothetical protein